MPGRYGAGGVGVLLRRAGVVVKGGITLAIYIAIGITGAAFGQAKPPPPPVVISYGQGGRLDEHKQQYRLYWRDGTKIELRGPCYSACTLLAIYVKPENLCIGQGAFMAFHAVRGMERGNYMEYETLHYFVDLPRPIQDWINDNGGWQKLPMDGFWTLYDRQMWAMGYPRCAP